MRTHTSELVAERAPFDAWAFAMTVRPTRFILLLSALAACNASPDDSATTAADGDASTDDGSSSAATASADASAGEDEGESSSDGAGSDGAGSSEGGAGFRSSPPGHAS